VKNSRINSFRKGFGFIEILIVLAIILFLGYKLLNVYFKRPSINPETNKALIEQGIDTTNYKTTADTVRNKIENIQKQRLDQLMDIK
jgi:prepilin-type N-terminal cleavage/methylation domain-containing protein